MKLLFLERKLNFASNATIFSGLHFLNLSQNLRDFLLFSYVARDFFADSALFLSRIFFAGQIFVNFDTVTESLTFSASGDVS